jgi:putative transposase
VHRDKQCCTLRELLRINLFEMKHRRSIRLKGYDYKQAGAYFVTICTRDRECLFGWVTDCEMRLNDIGRKAQAAWEALPTRFANMFLDAFIVMPNHIHGIILVGAQFIAPHHSEQNPVGVAPQGAMNRAPTLGEIVRTYKAVSTHLIRRTMKSDFAWQRNYYEHVIRDDQSLEHIRDYIVNNPARWADDEENPDHQTLSTSSAKP